MRSKHIAMGAMLVVALSGVTAATAQAAEDECVPAAAYTTTVDHPAVTHTETVHHEAVTHTVHHEAVPAGPDLWWNWSPNNTREPQDYEPAFPVDERGTWQGPHENGGPDQDTYGTFNASNENSGNSSWFHREHGTPAVDAYDEVVVDQEAYDEQVTVVDQDAYTTTVDHPAVTCPTTPDGPKPAPKPTITVTTTVDKPDQPKQRVAAPVPTVVEAGL